MQPTTGTSYSGPPPPSYSNPVSTTSGAGGMMQPPPSTSVLVSHPGPQDASGFGGGQKRGTKNDLTEPIPHIRGMEEREEDSYRRWFSKAYRPVVWRFLTFILSAVAFATISSAKFYDPTVNTTRRYTIDRPLNFIMAINVITMVWSFYLFMANVLALCRAWRPSETTKFIMPDVVLFIDTCLAFLMFGAGCAAAGLRENWRTGGSRGGILDFCGTEGSNYCNKVITTIVFTFVAWLFMLPSWYINTAWRTTGPW